MLALAAVLPSAQGQTFTVLHSFKGGTDGESPVGGVVRDAAGNLYGTTEYGGGVTCFFQDGCGTVFKLDTTGKETVLYSFTGGTDGEYPVGGVILDKAGNLYGATENGGTSGFGTVFKLNTTGYKTVLHSFTGGADGSLPVAGVIADTAGELYGPPGFCGGFWAGEGAPGGVTAEQNTAPPLYRGGGGG